MRNFLFLLFLSHSLTWGAEDTFAPSESDNESSINKLEWSGNLDVKYSLLHSRHDSPIYNIMYFPNQDTSSSLSQIRLEPYLNSDYVDRQIAFHLKSHGTIYSDKDSKFDLLELYGSLNPSVGSSVTGGKRAFNWGKGYAFNPVGFVNPPKDPENPELSQTGIVSFTGEYTKSIISDSLQTITLSAVILPAKAAVNHNGEFENTDLALKSYFLLWNTDLDILAYSSKVNAKQVGFDFSRNIFENLEIHGEFSVFRNATTNLVINDALGTDRRNASSNLVGFRYLNSLNTTLITEYYHNGAGLTKTEFENYREYLSSVLATGNVPQILQVQNSVKMNFQKPVLMRDYLYLKIIQPEPFAWVYFTPSLYSIINLQDNSFTLAAPLSYKPITNFELILTPTFFIGKNDSEFGGKQIGQRYEAWLRFYF
ncbi:MAG: hypothetical protein A2X86_12655 [Bdellovibrionales bacterium GWA2_49_15]|nr:MAG: hypothetical protein A2X86_12655 [Bdellovibrionales bacterium GWA2_49_15]HAZ14702.1 hypothetical protein [Bdellovibrionales bacterium]